MYVLEYAEIVVTDGNSLILDIEGHSIMLNILMREPVPHDNAPYVNSLSFSVNVRSAILCL